MIGHTHSEATESRFSLTATGTVSLLGVLVLALVCLTGCGESTVSLNQAALDSLASGDYTTAESKLMEAIKNRPVDRTLRRNLVEVYFRQGKWDEAIRLLKNTLTISGLESDLDLRSSLALAYTMSGESQRASAVLRALVEEDPGNEFILVLDGLTATAPQHAIASLTKAIEVNPDRKESYFGLARAYAYAGEVELARAALDKITEKFGPSADVALYEVSLCLRENNTEMARQSLAKLEESGETSPTARLFEAYLALADRKVEEAQTLFESIEGDPGLASRAKLGQALCLLTMGDVNLAIELCDEVVEEDPDEPVAYNLLGLGQLKRLQRFLAKKSFDKSLEINPDQPAIQALVDRIASL